MKGWRRRREKNTQGISVGGATPKYQKKLTGLPGCLGATGRFSVSVALVVRFPQCLCKDQSLPSSNSRIAQLLIGSAA